jgi:transcriptional regulator with XRE-family HTH domain
MYMNNDKSFDFIDLLNDQYQESNNKDKIDYWTPLSKMILECIGIRAKKDISQKDLADLMDTSQSVISRFENMGRKPSYDFITRLAFALGYSPGITLFGDYMAIVPEDKQEIVAQLSDNKQMKTQDFVQYILETGIENQMKYYNNDLTSIFSSTVDDEEEMKLPVLGIQPNGEFIGSISNINDASNQPAEILLERA